MNNFKTSRLGDFVNFQRGFDLLAKDRTEGHIPVISSSGVTGFHNEYKAEGEGVIIGRKGTLGSVHYTNKDYWPHDTTLWITDFKGNNPKFVYYFLPLLKLENFDVGSSNPTLNRNFVHELVVSLPDVETQKKIASVLSALDAKIDVNNRINAELEKLAKTIYDYWFVQFDFPNEDGKPYKASGGKMVYNDQLKRPIPAGWKVGKLNQLATIAGGSTPATENSSNFCQNGIAWITPKDLSLNIGNKFITRGQIDVTQEGMKNSSLRIFPKDTVLLSSRAPIGYLAISRNEVTTNQGFKSFICNQGYPTTYTYYAIKNLIPEMLAKASGSTFKEISKTVLEKDFNITLPTPKIIELYNLKVSPIFEQQNKLELQNQQLTQLRDWLLPLLMNGQVRVE